MKKRILLLFSVLGCILSLPAQVVVNDPTMLAESVKNWEHQLEQAKKQYEQITEQSKLLQESIDAYKKVNQAIKHSKKVKALIDKQVQIVSFLSKEMNNSPGDIVNSAAHRTYLKRMSSLIEVSRDHIVELTSLLTDGSFNLSDYERMKMIDDLNGRSTTIISVATMEKKRYETLNNQIKEINKLTAK